MDIRHEFEDNVIASIDRDDLPVHEAAFDLLAALELAYQKLGLWMDEDKWDDSDEKAMETMWAAITKARGE